MIRLFVTLVAAAGLATILTALVRGYALKRQLLDIPNSRSSHVVPTPRGGGVAIAIVVSAGLVGLAVSGMLPFRAAAALVIAGGAIAAVGWLDDRHGLSARVRFTVHVAAAAVALAGTAELGPLSVPGFASKHLLQSLVAMVAMAWMINLFNFMDGIDGLAAAEAVFFAMALCVCLHLQGEAGGAAGIYAALLAAGSLGFLVWNWPPARIFMGDVGSGFLGFGLGALSLVAHRESGLSLWVPIILAAVFVSDATVTLIVRVLRGERWYVAHRSHAYQRMARRLGAHFPVTMATATINVAWLLPLAALATLFPRWAPALTLFAFLPLVVLALRIGAGRPEQE